MKTLLLVSILAALPLASLAQTSSSTGDMTITGTKIIPSGPPYKMKVGEFDEIKGQYDLENGKTLTMSTTGRKMFADINGVSKVELVAAAPNIFYARNKQMKMVFDQEANGTVTGVMVSYIAPRGTGQNTSMR